MRATIAAAALLGAVLLFVGAFAQRTDGPPPLAYYLAPAQAAQVATAQIEAQTEQARIAAQLEAERAQQRTLRLAIVAAGVALTTLGAAVVLQLVRHARPPVIVLLPGDPGFNRALHDLGGVRINGVPMLDGRVVDAIDVEMPPERTGRP